MLKAYNEAMRYIEAHLADDIDLTRLCQLALTPVGLFSRIFVAISGMTLGEYIRYRRLSEAAKMLNHGAKVIDAAVTYRYESADAFSAAFKRFHGSSPSSVKAGAPFRVFPPLSFSLELTGGPTMDITITRKPAFTVAGLSMAATSESDFPGLWQRFEQHPAHSHLAKLGEEPYLGVCSDMTASQFTYTAGIKVANPQAARDLGFDVIEVPAAEYAIVPLHGSIPSCIHVGWKYVMGTFFEEQGYRHADTPDFEVYLPGDMHSPDYQMQLWVPVVAV